MDVLSPALAATSPRLNPPPTPLRALLIHGAVVALWLLLIAGAFRLGGVLAWSVGIAYIAYDTLLQGFTVWQLRALARPELPPAALPRERLGVIVAAHNEAAVLPVTLAALFAQDDQADSIVIADDGATDGTAALLIARYGLVEPTPGELSAPSTIHPSLRWLRLPHGGKARALNAALLALDTEVVLTVDADTLLEPNALAAFRLAFSGEHELVAATGVLAPVCHGGLEARFFQWFQTYEYIRNFLSRYAWMRVDGLLLISGAFAGFRREALLAVGGFDPACLVEDYELIHRLRRYSVEQGKGWRVRVLGGARARTDAPATVAAFLRQRRRWFGGFLQTQLWYRDMVGNRRYGALGLLMLPVKAIDTMQPLYGLVAFGLLVSYLVRGETPMLLPVSMLIGSKILIDLAFHLASVRWYRRWLRDEHRAHFGAALVAALIEPFSFQLLRHSGAALGWWTFLSGRSSWGRSSRTLAAATQSP
jgi:cellulose synthase/poly-beta-1,6-N-acetylglucosamine synthase-like glycosyltransferase